MNKRRKQRLLAVGLSLALLVGLFVALTLSTQAATTTPLGDMAIGDIVYIEEMVEVDGVEISNMVPYIVVEHNYMTTGNTILLRYYLFAEATYMSDTTGSAIQIAFDDKTSDGTYINEYKDSDLDTWLTGTYTSYLSSDITPYLVPIDLPYTGGYSNFTNSKIVRSVFTPSAVELGYDASGISYLNDDGSSPWSYFTSNKTTSNTYDAKLYVQGYGITSAESSVSCCWWTRSPYASSTDSGKRTWSIISYDDSGYTGSRYVYNSDTGIRPAVSISSSLLVSSSGEVFSYTAPEITSSPSDTTAKTGDVINLAVGVTEGSVALSDSSYTWYQTNSSTATGGTQVGTGASCNITATSAMDGTYIYCAIDDGTDNILTTTPAKLIVYYPHTTDVPEATAAVEGNTVSFDVAVLTAGNPDQYSYSWYLEDTGNGGGELIQFTDFSSSKDSTVSFVAETDDDGKYVYCVISNGQYDVTTMGVLLTVYNKIDNLSVVASTADGSEISSGTWVGEELFFTLSPSGDQIAYEMSTDGTTWTETLNPATYHQETPSTGTTLYFRAYDARCTTDTDKAATVSNTVTFIAKIDTTPPEFTVTIQNMS